MAEIERVELDPISPKLRFAELVDEVVLQFSARSGVRVSIKVEIEADGPAGFDEALQRAVNENCQVLRFRTAEFESGE